LSKENKKVKFFSLEFQENYVDKFFNKDKFKKILERLFLSEIEDRMLPRDSNKNYKALLLKDWERVNDFTYKLLFNSCRYNFSPNLISSLDATERPSDKKMYEGEKEKTHMILNINKNEVLVIMENNSTGVSITQLVYYFNNFFDSSFIFPDKDHRCKIIYSIIPSEGFREALSNTKRIRMAEIFTTKKSLGSEFRNNMDREGGFMREDILLTLRAERKESLLPRMIENFFNKYSSAGSEINRIRIYGKDKEDNKIKLDTKTFEKTEYINTQINENGTVNSDSIFSSLEKILDNFIDE